MDLECLRFARQALKHLEGTCEEALLSPERVHTASITHDDTM